ncbi:hypothetical protein O181_010054 [Austropuccinia psidii MF-1]|uniref:Diphthine--ammonia ligase n=1 Tax=Austropuccinia psidii MF-1 TaxID=1389203 RepID=A0A9Q3BQB7_9BASI|nr:hypothetical protein [Austropuccinia psidii MF-1]
MGESSRGAQTIVDEIYFPSALPTGFWGMKVVGLLSGGKDSCYNLCHCVKNGHQIVALASLGPQTGKDELDSYLYQTVGQDGVHLIAQALALPLHRQTIQGTALDLRSEYGDRQYEASMKGLDGDETEDMYNLLRQVKLLHPDITAVSVGAILSTYQRVRVEHVCQRLGLVSLAYLWQRNQDELLGEMIKASLESLLIKVASIGLMPGHLGKTLKEMQPILQVLNSKYDVHICGEGGEYETFTTDCPLFQSKILLDKVQLIDHPESSPISPVAYLRLLSATLVSKPIIEPNLENVTIPPLLDEESLHTVDAISSHQESSCRYISSMTFSADCDTLSQNVALGSKSKDQSQCTQCASVGHQPKSTSENLGWVTVAAVVGYDSRKTLSEEVMEAFDSLEVTLTHKSLSLIDIAHINVSLSSMEDFAEVNAVYATKFGTSPPTRACIAVSLDHNARVMIDAIARRPACKSTREVRLALHVQSRSYWAPANIGPYSQAIMIGSRIFVAGQIGLIPASLTLPTPPSFLQEAVLSLQHTRRILATFRTPWWVEGAICYMSDISNLAQARMVWNHSKTLFNDKVPILFLEVAGLPKGALVEWQITIQCNQISDDCESDEESIGSFAKYFADEAVGFKGCSFSYSKDVTIVGTATKDSVLSIPPLNVTYLRAFHTPGISVGEAREVLSKAFNIYPLSQCAMSLVCVNSIALDTGSANLDIGYYMMGSII